MKLILNRELLLKRNLKLEMEQYQLLIYVMGFLLMLIEIQILHFAKKVIKMKAGKPRRKLKYKE